MPQGCIVLRPLTKAGVSGVSPRPRGGLGWGGPYSLKNASPSFCPTELQPRLRAWDQHFGSSSRSPETPREFGQMPTPHLEATGYPGKALPLELPLVTEDTPRGWLMSFPDGRLKPEDCSPVPATLQPLRSTPHSPCGRRSRGRGRGKLVSPF